jgi:glycogen synthase
MLTFEYGPLHNGGLGTMVTSLCRAIDKQVFEPVIVLPKSGLMPSWERVRELTLPYCSAEVYRSDGCEIWLLQNAVLDDGVIYPEPACYAAIKKYDDYGERVAELLDQLDIDLVHLHDVFGYKCLYAARSLKKPTIMTVHRLHYDEPAAAFGEMAAVALVDRVTTVSASYLAENRAFFGAAKITQVISNGVDTDFFGFQGDEGVTRGRLERRRQLLSRLQLPPRPTFAYVGRLDGEQKGIDVLLDAYTSELSGAPLNLLLVGEGEAPVTRSIEAVAGMAKERVRFVNRLCPAEEVREILGAIDFIVIPSRYEPFGLIQLEAMAMGAVPIASRTGGLRDVILDMEAPNGFGRLVDPGDAAALARGILEMMQLEADRPERVDELREAGSIKVKEHSARVMAGRYEALYRSALTAC